MASDRKPDQQDTLKLGAPAPVLPPRPAPIAREEPSDTDEVTVAGVEHTSVLLSSPAPPLSSPAAHGPGSLAPISMAPESTRSDDIEFHVIREHHVTSAPRRTWRAFEVWTRHNIYGIDSQMICFEIIDRATGKPDAEHAMLGARLGGGRQREEDFVRYAYPLPVPGMAAMFTQGRKHGYTSTVDRVVVRVRVLQARPNDALPSWEEIASRWEPTNK